MRQREARRRLIDVARELGDGRKRLGEPGRRLNGTAREQCSGRGRQGELWIWLREVAREQFTGRRRQRALRKWLRQPAREYVAKRTRQSDLRRVLNRTAQRERASFTRQYGTTRHQLGPAAWAARLYRTTPRRSCLAVIAQHAPVGCWQARTAAARSEWVANVRWCTHVRAGWFVSSPAWAPTMNLLRRSTFPR